MFWGVTLETGKRYSQRVEESYHLTMAALEPPSADKTVSKHVSIMVEHQKSDYMICTLEPNRNLQCHLDHMFVEGEEVTYYLVGDGTVHLTGYLVGDPYDDFDEEGDEEDEESSDEEVSTPQTKNGKRKNELLDSSPESADDSAEAVGKEKPKQQQNQSKQQNQANSPQKQPNNQQKQFGSAQKGGFQGNQQKGGQQQKGQWNQSG
ncbi:unnamed protein product, partial [Medioppia subpectinata]